MSYYFMSDMGHKNIIAFEANMNVAYIRIYKSILIILS